MEGRHGHRAHECVPNQLPEQPRSSAKSSDPLEVCPRAGSGRAANRGPCMHETTGTANPSNSPPAHGSALDEERHPSQQSELTRSEVRSKQPSTRGTACCQAGRQKPASSWYRHSCSPAAQAATDPSRARGGTERAAAPRKANWVRQAPRRRDRAKELVTWQPRPSAWGANGWSRRA